MKNKNVMFALLIALALISVSYASLVQASISSKAQASHPHPIPVPDEDINKYIGQVVDPSIVSHIFDLLMERYPRYTPSVEMKFVEYDQSWTTDRAGKETLVLHLKRVLISKVEIYRDVGTEAADGTTSGPWYYDGTLSPGYGKVHGNYYLVGTAEFSSYTTWSPQAADAGIGLYNRDTQYGRTHTYIESPADDISYNWDTLHYYGHLVWNPSWNSDNISFECSYSWDYV